MEFHPDKCEIISITRKRNPVKYPYTLHGHLLKHVDVLKYLGVKISHELESWGYQMVGETDGEHFTILLSLC